MIARELSQREIDLGKELLRQAEKKAIQQISDYSKLPAADPLRVILEFISLTSAQIKNEIELIPMELAKQLPSFFGLKSQKAKPATALVECTLAQSHRSGLHLPCDTPFKIGNSQTQKQFVLESNQFVFDYGKIELIEGKSEFYFGLDRVPGMHNPKFYFEIEPHRQSSELTWSIRLENGWKDFSVSDRTDRLTQNGFIQFFLAELETQRTNFRQIEKIWLRCRSQSGKSLPGVRRIRQNVLVLKNKTSFDEICIGSGDSTQSQRFSIPDGQITKAFKLKVFDGETGEFEYWREVPNFFMSEPDSRHFLVDQKNSEVVFGDGVRGRCAPPGYDNIFIEDLELTDGSQGNISQDASVELESEDFRVQEFRLIKASQGGVDAILDQDQLKRLHQLLINRDRAVTLHDFEILAMEANSRVGKAYAQHYNDSVFVYPILRPDYSKSPRSLDFKPESEDLDLVKDYLDERKSLNTALSVKAVSPRQLVVRASIYLRRLDEEIKNKIEDFILRYFSPYSLDGQEIKPGACIHIDRFHDYLDRNPDIIAVQNLQVEDSQSSTASSSVQLASNELPQVSLQLNMEERLR